MKKIFIVGCAAFLMLVTAGCSKVDKKMANEAPVCKKIEFHIEWSNLSSDITNNLTITASGKDFNDVSFNEPIAEEAGAISFVKENVNIDNIGDNCPFTYKITVENRGESGDESEAEYSPKFKMQVYAVFRDAEGNALRTNSAGETKDIIVDADYTNSDKIRGFEKFKNFVDRHIGSEERTYVFFRGQNSATGGYFFSHSSK